MPTAQFGTEMTLDEETGMLSDHERRQWDALEAQLMGDSRRATRTVGRGGLGLRPADHSRRTILLAAATVLLGAGYVLPFIPFFLFGVLALYLAARGWVWTASAVTAGGGRNRGSGRG